MIALTQLRPYTGDVVATSPNHGARRAAGIEGIVLHATEDDGNEDQMLEWLCSPKSKASCHLLVSRSGQVTRLVGDRHRAWHAAGASWRGTRDVNSVTLGIEIANRNDGEPFTDAQYARIAAIVAHYCRQGLALGSVVGHGDIASPRKANPDGWEWARFRTMVEQQLRATPGEPTSGPTAGPVTRAYDRRSASRQAADAVAAAPPPADEPPSSPGDATMRARAPGAPILERRMTPRSGDRRAAPARPRTRAPGAPKPALRSRTLWINGLAVLASGSVIVGDVLDLAHSVGLTLPQEVTMWALFGIGLVNILLRFQTTGPIGSGQGVEGTYPEATIRMTARVPTHELRGAAAGR